MNDPSFFIILGVVMWVLVVACFVLGFGWMYKNPRNAWQRGYHRKGLMRLLGSWPRRESTDGEPTEQDLAEVRRRSILGLVIGLVLSPAIVALAMLIAYARDKARHRGRVGEAPIQGAAEQVTLTDSQEAEIAKADAAIADYTAIIERDPDHACDAYVKRGEAYRRKGAVIGDFAHYTGEQQFWERRSNTARGELDKAIADFTTALKLAPDDASIYFKRCLSHFDKDNFPDDYRKGMADYLEAIRRDPQLAQSFNHLPAEYPEDGSPIYPFSLRDLARCSRAIEADPKKAEAYDNRANVYQELAAFDLAVADYSEAFRLDPTNPRRYSLRGFCYFSNGDYENAIADFDEAIRLDPKDTDAHYDYYHRGLAHLGQREYDNAIADFTKVLDLKPKNLDALIQRGVAHTDQSQYDKGIADFSEAIGLDPKSAEAYQELGRAYYIRGVDCSSDEPDRAKAEYDKAIAACSEAIRLDPKSADAYFTRARAHEAKGEIDTAISDYSVVLRLIPNASWDVYERGMLFLKTKQFANAVRDFSEAIRLDATPEAIARQGYASLFNRATGYIRRGQAYAGQKDYERAIADYNEAIRVYGEDDGFAQRASVGSRVHQLLNRTLARSG